MSRQDFPHRLVKMSAFIAHRIFLAHLAQNRHRVWDIPARSGRRPRRTPCRVERTNDGRLVDVCAHQVGQSLQTSRGHQSGCITRCPISGRPTPAQFDLAPAPSCFGSLPFGWIWVGDVLKCAVGVPTKESVAASKSSRVAHHRKEEVRLANGKASASTRHASQSACQSRPRQGLKCSNGARRPSR